MNGAHLPDAPDAERAVLGAVLINGYALRHLSGLRPEHFLDHRHREIWLAVGQAAEAGDVDFVTVSDHLQPADHSYLAGLMVATPNSYHAETYAAQVVAAFRARGWIADANALGLAAFAKDEGAALAAIESARRRLQDAARDGAESAQAVAARVWDTVADPAGIAANVLKLGLSSLDKATGGAERKTAVCFFARPSMGKSAVMVQVSDEVTARGERCLVLTKEHSADQWFRRMAFRRARANWQAFRRGEVDAEAQGRVLAELAALAERTNLVFDDTPQTSEQAMDTARRVADKLGGLDWIISDHLRLFRDRSESEVKRLGKISQNLKAIAGELNAVSVYSAQLNRGVEGQDDKRPDLKDLRDSGEIEENIDDGWAIYRDKYYRPDSAQGNVTEFWLRKAREGERNNLCKMAFLLPHMSFEPAQARDDERDTYPYGH